MANEKSGDGSKETMQKDSGKEDSNIAQPPYTDICPQYSVGHPLPGSTSPYRLLTRLAAKSRKSRRNELQLALLEIIAVTFYTDCQRIKDTLAKSEPTWATFARIKDSSSTTDKEGRARIAEMSALVQHLSKETSCECWHLVQSRIKILSKRLC